MRILLIEDDVPLADALVAFLNARGFVCECTGSLAGARAMLPGICRIDYLFSHLMGNGFTRTQTLGDGDACCNCRYQLKGTCEWSPEKGFLDRK